MSIQKNLHHKDAKAQRNTKKNFLVDFFWSVFDFFVTLCVFASLWFGFDSREVFVLSHTKAGR